MSAAGREEEAVTPPESGRVQWWISDEGCGKRCFRSSAAAKAAHAQARWRVRIYFCRPCRAFHATNQDKHARETRLEARARAVLRKKELRKGRRPEP